MRNDRYHHGRWGACWGWIQCSEVSGSLSCLTLSAVHVWESSPVSACCFLLCSRFWMKNSPADQSGTRKALIHYQEPRSWHIISITDRCMPTVLVDASLLARCNRRCCYTLVDCLQSYHDSKLNHQSTSLMPIELSASWTISTNIPSWHSNRNSTYQLCRTTWPEVHWPCRQSPTCCPAPPRTWTSLEWCTLSPSNTRQWPSLQSTCIEQHRHNPSAQHKGRLPRNHSSVRNWQPFSQN